MAAPLPLSIRPSVRLMPSQHRTVIDDAVVEDVAASCGMAAAGLYMMLERRVNSDGIWTTTTAQLAMSFGQTDRHVRDAANALERAGFLVRESISGPNGMTIGVRYKLPKHLRTYGAEPRDEPTPAPTPEPSCAAVEVLSEVVTSKPPTEVTPPLPPKADPVQLQFETEFWPDYPKGRGSRSDALKVWRKLSAADRAAAVAALPAFLAGGDWRRGFHKGPEVWLRGRCWENPPAPWVEPPRPGYQNGNGKSISEKVDEAMSNIERKKVGGNSVIEAAFTTGDRR